MLLFFHRRELTNTRWKLIITTIQAAVKKNVGNKWSRIINSYTQQINLQEASSMEAGHDDGIGVQREYILNALTNDEALLNNFLQFRQQQAQYRILKAGHGVFPHHGSVVSNKQLTNKQFNESTHLQSRVQVQKDTSTPNKRRFNDSTGSGGLLTPKQQRSGNEQLQDNEITLDAPVDSQQGNTTLKTAKQHKISFDQVKRAVSSNLPCFYISFNVTVADQKVPSAFKAADQVFEHLKSKMFELIDLPSWVGQE